MEIKEGLENYIVKFDNVMPERILKYFSKYIKQLNEFQEAKIVSQNGQIIDHNIRKVTTKSMNIYTKSLTEIHWANFLKFTFIQFINDYQRIFDTKINFNISNIELLKYEEGGHYKFHVDDCAEIHRTFSCIFLVNDDYEGGELLFKNISTKETIKIDNIKNRLIIWPSNFLFPHSVAPVTKGERFSVVSWAL